jgi:shikimate kinase
MKNIVLIGPSGIGKTTIGKYISKKLNIVQIDTDDLIEEKTNMSIKDTFDIYGEDFFRTIEVQVVKEIADKENILISTGGGIVLREENIHALRSNGIIFFLNGKIETIVRNLNSSDVDRPLLMNEEDMYEKIKKLFLERKKLYYSSCDYLIDVDDKSVESIGDEIIFYYDKH